MREPIDYKTSADARAHTAFGSLEREIERITGLVHFLNSIPGNVMSEHKVSNVIRYLLLKREDYETEIKRRNQFKQKEE